jgi:hypothetical protein
VALATQLIFFLRREVKLDTTSSSSELFLLYKNAWACLCARGYPPLSFAPPSYEPYSS